MTFMTMLTIRFRTVTMGLFFDCYGVGWILGVLSGWLVTLGF